MSVLISSVQALDGKSIEFKLLDQGRHEIGVGTFRMRRKSHTEADLFILVVPSYRGFTIPREIELSQADIAAIERNPSGSKSEFHCFIEK